MSEDKKPLRDPYEFYDEYEIEDIHTGETYHYNDKPAAFGLIGGGLALLACLIIVALMGVIYHRDKRSVPLSHLVMACIGVLAAALCAGVCVMTKGAMAKRGNINHMLLAIGLIAALIFFAYFLASSVYIFMYRPFHYSAMTAKYNNRTEWDDTFGNNWTFEDGWGEDRRIIWWVVFFGLVATVGFLIAAICLWLLSQFPVQSARLALGAACFAGVLLGLFAIDYLWTARKELSGYATRNMNHRLLLTLLVLLAVGVFLLFVNAILNMLKKRVGHFVLGILLIIFLFIFICVLGLVLRDLRKRQFSTIKDNSNCAAILDSLHEDDIKDACPQKYLTGTCTKEFLVRRWERGSDSAFLNPGCCQSINSRLLWNLYIVGCLSLLFATAVLVAIAFDLYLSDPSEYLEFADKKFGLFELVFVVLCLLALIAFGFYWGFRPDDKELRQNGNNPNVVSSGYLNNVEGYEAGDYEVVDLHKVYNDSIPDSAFGHEDYKSNSANATGINDSDKSVDSNDWFTTSNSILTLKDDPSICQANWKCGFRLGILAKNGQFRNYSATNKNLGSERARSLFFNDSNSNNDFILLFGSADELNKVLRGLSVSSTDISQDTTVIFNGEQLNLDDLDSLGLKNGENLSNVTLTSTGASFNLDNSYEVKGFSSNRECYYNNSCQSDLVCVSNGQKQCKKAFVFYPNDGLIDVLIPLKVLNKDGNQVDYNESSIRSTSYYTYNGKKVFINNVGLKNANATFKVPNPVKSGVVLDINLFDKANHYLPVSQRHHIPIRSANPYITEDVLLLTKNGKGCVGEADVNKCFNDAKLSYTDIEVLVKDGETGEEQDNLDIKLYSGQTLDKYLSKDETNEHGYASFENVAYDNYTIVFEGNDEYQAAKEAVLLQSEKDGSVTLLLNKADSSNVVLEQYISNGDVDRDLVLSVVSYGTEQCRKSGAKDCMKSCKVDPLNKYCAYATFETDVQKNRSGYEKIDIEKFTVSYYLVYLRDSPKYTQTCSANKSAETAYYPKSKTTLRSLNYDWQSERKLANTNVNYQTLYCFTGWGMNSKKAYRKNTGSKEPTAADCASLYPSSSDFNVGKLQDANNK